jgi:hypothetical protein
VRVNRLFAMNDIDRGHGRPLLWVILLNLRGQFFSCRQVSGGLHEIRDINLALFIQTSYFNFLKATPRRIAALAAPARPPGLRLVEPDKQFSRFRRFRTEQPRDIAHHFPLLGGQMRLLPPLDLAGGLHQQPLRSPRSETLMA